MTDKMDYQYSDFIKISGLDNAFEAQLVASILTERGIPHQIQSHHDTAYDGLYQMQMGWGEIFAPSAYQSVIAEIIHQVRSEIPDIESS